LKPRETIGSYRLPTDASPVITSITYQQRDKLRASVFVGNVFAFGINVATIEQFRLRKGDELTESLLEQLRQFDERISAKRTATKYLNSRRRSEHEVTVKLRGEGYEPEVIEEITSGLKSYGLINDLEFARALIHDKLISKSSSRRELQMLLAKKGIAKDMTAEILADVTEVGDEDERAMKAAEKKWATLVRREPDARKRKQKLYAFLGSRGFGGATIKKIVLTLEGNANDEEEHFED
jgi:regulatory protein